jgi:hypothetical protein
MTMHIEQDTTTAAWVCQHTGMLRAYEVVHLIQFIGSQADAGSMFLVLDLSATRLTGTQSDGKQWITILKRIQHPNVCNAVIVLPEGTSVAYRSGLQSMIDSAGITDKITFQPSQDDALGLFAANA